MKKTFSNMEPMQRSELQRRELLWLMSILDERYKGAKDSVYVIGQLLAFYCRLAKMTRLEYLKLSTLNFELADAIVKRFEEQVNE